MTAATVRPVGQPDPVREALIAAGHHNLAFCQFCSRPTAGPMEACDDPDCQRKELQMDLAFVRREDR